MNQSIFRSGRRNRYAAPIGGVFIILCFVGFFTVASFCLDATKDLLDNSKRKQEFETMLLPVVIFDPVPFENPVNIDNASLLQYSIWSTAMGEKRDQYEYDDNNMMIIPASDVEVAAQRLFGSDVKLEHRSFGNLQDSYLYEEEIRSYHVPIITITGFATPKVEEINKVSGDVIELKMGYVPPSTILELDAEGNIGEPEPQKYMSYEMHKNRSGWYLYAVKDLAATRCPRWRCPAKAFRPARLCRRWRGTEGSPCRKTAAPPPMTALLRKERERAAKAVTRT